MGIKTIIKEAASNNPIAKHRRRQMRLALTNHDFSFFTPNCMAGILMHDLGLRFLTPTVNLMMKQTDFLQFMLNLDQYLKGEFRFFVYTEYSCPCAHLHCDGLPDVDVHFIHFHTREEAERKWRERAERINRDNMFVLLEERDGITRTDLERLGSLRAKGVLAFTCNPYPDIPYCVYLPQYHSDGEVGNILKKTIWDDSREYEHIFDFVKWFNDADGKSYDVRQFVKNATLSW